MDLDLSDDQRLVQRTARAFLEKESSFASTRARFGDAHGFDREVWAHAAALGWVAPFVPEEYGGGSVSGGALADSSIILEEAGRAVFPGPLIPTSVVADAIARSGSPEQRASYLPGLVDGSIIGTWAFAERSGRWDADGVQLLAARRGDGYVLSGTKSFVQDAAAADVLLVTARAPDGLIQLVIPSDRPGVTVTPLVSLDLARRFAEVELDDVHVTGDAVLGAVGEVTDRAVDRQLAVATTLVCAETVGALDRGYEMTLDYAKERKAFGRPIGSFQALKHRFADMLLWLEGAKAVAVAAAKAVDQDAGRAEMVGIAKSYISERGPMIVRDCLQIHGGIGYTWEHDLHLLLRRVESNAALYGGVDDHRDRLVVVLGVDRTRESA